MICNCGYAFDWLRKGYDTYMRVYSDLSLPPVKVTWYRCAPGAKWFPGAHCFQSTVWETDARDYPAEGLGEVDLVRRKRSVVIHKEDGQGPISTPLSWFLQGVPSGYVPKECCGEPLGRGIGEVAEPGVVGWFAEGRNPRNLGLLELSNPGSRIQGWESWVAELAGPGLNALDLVGELAGPEVEHDPPRRGVGELAGPELAWPGGSAELVGIGINALDLVGEVVGPGGQYVPDRDGALELAGGNVLVPSDGEVSELAGPEGRELVAVPLTLFNSGVDNHGVKLLDLQPDTHWEATLEPDTAAAITQRHDYIWMPDAESDLSSWVSQAADGHIDPLRLVTYTAVFAVADASVFAGKSYGGWACVDNGVFGVYVNGNVHLISADGPGWHSFALPGDDLVDGDNTIAFLCWSDGVPRSVNEEGFRIEWFRGS